MRKFKLNKQVFVEEAPSISDQNIAEAYCLHRPLNRPKINIKTLIMWLLCYEGIVIAVSSGFNSLFIRIGVSFSFLQIYHFTSLLCLIVAMRWILILFIKLYQHYAPEEVRRRCVCMPTCSEYAILALKKYGVIRGLSKIYIRIFDRCQGKIYKIDYP